ncbi:MAG: DUF6122 family protein [Nanoarchaeota archaeon]
MITVIHIAFSLLIYLILNKFIIIKANIVLLLSAELIDLDHLFSKPIYVKKRNPFKTHFLHKHWITLLIISIIFLFIKDLMLLGIGIISHLFLDFLYIKIYHL